MDSTLLKQALEAKNKELLATRKVVQDLRKRERELTDRYCSHDITKYSCRGVDSPHPFPRKNRVSRAIATIHTSCGKVCPISHRSSHS